MLEYGEKFKKGVVQQGGYTPEVADRIWEKILKFARYGFNKSHSACYALMSYRTAYLKANDPAEFMAAVLNGELGNAEKLAFYISEAGHMGLDIEPPDVNRSQLRFGVSDGVILFGLGAVKGVGSAAARTIIEKRAEGGEFSSLQEFCERVEDTINRRVLENLTKAGAFDGFNLQRSQVFEMLEDALKRAQQAARDKRSGQTSFFDLLDPGESGLLQLTPPDIPPWEERERLKYEKELLGFYVTGHPTDQFADLLQTYQIDRIAEVPIMPDGTGTRVGGIVSGLDLKRSKRDNRQWAIATLEDPAAEVDCMIFSDTYERVGEILTEDELVFVEGTVSRRDGEAAKLIGNKVIPVERAPQDLTSEILILVDEHQKAFAQMQDVLALCHQYPGDIPVVLSLRCQSGTVAFVRLDNAQVSNCRDFYSGLLRILGEDKVRCKPNLKRPEERARKRFYPRSKTTGQSVDAAD